MSVLLSTKNDSFLASSSFKQAKRCAQESGAYIEEVRLEDVPSGVLFLALEVRVLTPATEDEDGGEVEEGKHVGEGAIDNPAAQARAKAGNELSAQHLTFLP